MRFPQTIFLDIAEINRRMKQGADERRALIIRRIGLACVAVIIVLLASCSNPSDPIKPDDPNPQDTTISFGTWRSEYVPGLITYELKDREMWLIADGGEPPPYALVTVMNQDGDTLRIEAWHVTAPGLVYAFALARDGSKYRGRHYSPKGIWKQRAIVFTKASAG